MGLTSQQTIFSHLICRRASSFWWKWTMWLRYFDNNEFKFSIKNKWGVTFNIGYRHSGLPSFGVKLYICQGFLTSDSRSSKIFIYRILTYWGLIPSFGITLYINGFSWFITRVFFLPLFEQFHCSQVNCTDKFRH